MGATGVLGGLRVGESLRAPQGPRRSQREGVPRCRENHPWQPVSARPPVQGAPRMLPCRYVITGPAPTGAS